MREIAFYFISMMCHEIAWLIRRAALFTGARHNIFGRGDYIEVYMPEYYAAEGG